ncbi:MAG: AbrB/MazE/SpoVT family DNA-binding domain-containing protein [Bacteroidota bacterium]
MEVSVIQIGNSKGIRIAKSILEEYGITDKVELVLKEGFLILRPIHLPRQGWEEAFQEMAKNGDDQLLIDDFFEDESMEE